LLFFLSVFFSAGALDLYYRQAAAALSQRVSPTTLQQQQQQQQQPPRGRVYPSSVGTGGPAGALSLSLLPGNNSPGQRSSTSSSLLSNSAAGTTVNAAANASSNLSRPSSVEKT
jgi:hypothetical protein